MSKINDLKLMNNQKIRECFYDMDIWTKNKLSKKTGISLAKVTNTLQELLDHKEILFIGEAKSTGGRKSKEYILNKDYYHLLKIILKRNIDSYDFIVSIVNLNDEVLYSHAIHSLTGRVDEFITLVIEALKHDSNISLITVSIPGVCKNGYIDICDFKAFEHINLKDILHQYTSLDIILENDVNIACIGFYHSYKNDKNIAFFYQPKVEYVGVGMIIDGKLYNGFSHFAGELRYLPFYSHSKQDELLKTHPMELLSNQIETLCCTMNPEIIGVYSDVIDDLTALQLSHIPYIHQPHIIFINDYYEMINKGIYQIGLKNLLEREGK